MIKVTTSLEHVKRRARFHPLLDGARTVRQIRVAPDHAPQESDHRIEDPNRQQHGDQSHQLRIHLNIDPFTKWRCWIRINILSV